MKRDIELDPAILGKLQIEPFSGPFGGSRLSMARKSMSDAHNAQLPWGSNTSGKTPNPVQHKPSQEGQQ